MSGCDTWSLYCIVGGGGIESPPPVHHRYRYRYIDISSPPWDLHPETRGLGFHSSDPGHRFGLSLSVIDIYGGSCGGWYGLWEVGSREVWVDEIGVR